MREFFRGWRRKAGCVMLVMACAVCCAWVASTRIGFSAQREIGDWMYHCDSFNNDFSFGWYNINDGGRQREIKFTTLRSKMDMLGLEIGRDFHSGKPPRETELVKAARLAGHKFPSNHRILIVPYWIIVLPLTLLSAYLLLWTPRKRTGPDHA